MKNTFGSAVSLTIFGESHGPAVGAVLDGLAAGLPVDADFLARQMDRRRARGDGLSTARTEADEVEFLSGVYEGHTTGTAVTLTCSPDAAWISRLDAPVLPLPVRLPLLESSTV